MKKLFTLLTAVLLTATLNSQSPNRLSYQAVVRNSGDALVQNASVGFQISILQGSAGGTAVYVETHTVSTNGNGLATLEIGGGTPVTGTLAGIDWSAGPYFLKTETDPTGGTTYTITGTSQLLSVPYAMQAKTAETAKNAWSSSGNTGTVDGIDFIGTTDNVPLNIRVNNQKAGRIDQALNNSFWGYQSGKSNTTGYFNTASGHASLSFNTTGYGNSASGYQALNYNTTGNSNTAFGANALANNSAGYNGTAIGTRAMYYVNNSSSAYENLNVAVGFEALYGSTTASANTGNNNTAIGYKTLRSNTTGYSNTATGTNSLYWNTTGSNNTAIGNYSLNSNNTGNSNTAIGYLALRFNTSGNYNTSTGVWALSSNTSGSNNTANGYMALNSNIAGSNATAIGYNAMYYTNNSSTPFTNFNVALGYEALRGSTTSSANTGNKNTALGYQTLWSNTSGGTNTASGYQALYGNTTGSNNTTLGYQAGYTATPANANTTGSNNTFIGFNSGPGTSTQLTNATAIGYNALVSADNSLVLGGTGADAVKVGIGVTAPSATFEIAGNVKIVDGSQGAGKVLTSDATGTASWVNSFSGVNADWNAVSGLAEILNKPTIPTNTNQLTNGAGFLSSEADPLWSAASSNYYTSTYTDASFAAISHAHADATTTVSGFLSGTDKTKLDGLTNADGSETVVNSGTNISVTGSGTSGDPYIVNASGGSGWALAGNAGTVDGTDFIGTTDNVPFNIRVNNQKSGRIDPTLFNTSFGYQAANSNNTGTNNTAIGYQSLFSTNSGKYNTAIGYQSLFSNTSGNHNISTGHAAQYSNTTGSYNTAYGSAASYNNINGTNNSSFGFHSQYSNKGSNNTSAGYNALAFNTTGSYNTAFGVDALKTNYIGNYITAVGYQAGVTTDGLTNATAIGYNALVSADNSLVLGGTGADAVKVGIGVAAPSATLEVAGNVKIVDGTQGAGKVLTSDANGVATWETPGGSGAHYLGEEYLGGIIYNIYIGSDGQQHGLIVSLTETDAIWSGSTVVNADRTEDGDYNTSLMPTGAGTARTWVEALGAGWYLPSIDELELLYHSRYYVNKTARAVASTLLNNYNNYWSSTEFPSGTSAYVVHFGSGGHANNMAKTGTGNVRAVMSF